MKIEYFYAHPPTITIEEFADQHGLTMEVHQRAQNDYYAHFKNSETRDGNILEGTYGNGVNDTEAIKNYAREISGKILVIDDKEIQVPILKGY